MNTATLILSLFALGLFLYAWQRGDGSHLRGIRQGAVTLQRTSLLLLIAFMITGYISVLSPQELVSTWIGPNSGWTGIFLGEIVGIFLLGGPYVVFPLVAVLYQNGAGLAPVVTIVASWAAIGLLRLAFEIPFMGWRFAAIRWGLAALVPLIVGIVAQLFFGGM